MADFVVASVLDRPAAEVAREPQFPQFLDALEKATRLDRTAIRHEFDKDDGTVADVLRKPLAGYGLDDLNSVLALIREVGSAPLAQEIERCERELTESRAKLSTWHRFIDHE